MRSSARRRRGACRLIVLAMMVASGLVRTISVRRELARENGGRRWGKRGEEVERGDLGRGRTKLKILDL